MKRSQRSSSRVNASVLQTIHYAYTNPRLDRSKGGQGPCLPESLQSSHIPLWPKDPIHPSTRGFRGRDDHPRDRCYKVNENTELRSSGHEDEVGKKHAPLDGTEDGCSTRTKDLQDLALFGSLDKFIEVDGSFADRDLVFIREVGKLILRPWCSRCMSSEETEKRVSLVNGTTGQAKQTVSNDMPGGTHGDTRQNGTIELGSGHLDFDHAITPALFENNDKVHLSTLGHLVSTRTIFKTPQVLLETLCQGSLLGFETRRIVGGQFVLSCSTGPCPDGRGGG